MVDLVPKPYVLGFEDELMDVSVRADGRLVWYIEAKERARQAEQLVGSVLIGERLAMIQLTLEEVGASTALQLAAFSEWTFFPDPNADPTTFDMVTDQAPDVIWPDEPAQWISLP